MIQSELAFLLDLILNHKIPKATKLILATRIVEVEKMSKSLPTSSGTQQIPLIIPQAPSTIKAMIKHGEIPTNAVSSIPELPKVEPVQVIAQTPQTAAAMQSRQHAITTRSIDENTGRPRKW